MPDCHWPTPYASLRGKAPISTRQILSASPLRQLSHYPRTNIFTAKDAESHVLWRLFVRAKWNHLRYMSVRPIQNRDVNGNRRFHDQASKRSSGRTMPVSRGRIQCVFLAWHMRMVARRWSASQSLEPPCSQRRKRGMKLLRWGISKTTLQFLICCDGAVIYKITIEFATNKTNLISINTTSRLV